MTKMLRMTEEQLAARQGKAFLKPKANKYNAMPTVVDGIRFASKKEAYQDAQLALRQGSGQISDLQRQVPFPFIINGVEICTYFADWTYRENGDLVVRDAKGRKTDVYRLKSKLMLALYGITILET
jgi:hypothetical protein